jgi:AcrR family transcriptional regulator/DNA-binding MarR family transcriptional regulator
MLAAAVDAVGDIGYARLTVAAVISRARVSRKTFYEVFADREDCFLAVFEHAIARATAAATDAYGQGASWRAGIRCALGSLLMLIDDEPTLAKLWIVEAAAAGHEVSQRRSEILAALAEAIDRGRVTASAKGQPPQVSAEGVVGGALAVLHTRIMKRAEEPMINLLGPLMYMIVLPYLGPRAASRELEKPAPRITRQRKAPASPRLGDPLDGLRMRLTYRTVMALAAIAEHPGASSREVAEVAGVIDQGQISKLLSRLAGLELIENHGDRQEKGAAKSWRLTERGAKVLQAANPRGVLA